VSSAERWLAGRLEGAPPGLLDCMREALPADEVTVPEALASAAMRLLADVATSDGTRGQALPLLAADALLTHAFQAQAEIDVAGTAGLAERYGIRGALGEIADRLLDQDQNSADGVR